MKLSCFHWIYSVVTCKNTELTCKNTEQFPLAIQLLTALHFLTAGHFQVTDGDPLQCSQSNVKNIPYNCSQKSIVHKISSEPKVNF